MEARVVGNIPLMKYDENRIPVGDVFVTFEAVQQAKDCRILLKPNWRDYIIGGINAERNQGSATKTVSGK